MVDIKRNGSILWQLILYLILFGAGPAQAQQDIFEDAVPVFRIGDSKIQMRLGLSYLQEQDDYSTNSGSSSDSVQSTALEPGVQWTFDNRNNETRIRYIGNYRRSSISDLDFNDHTVSLDSLTHISSRLRIGVTAASEWKHDEFGTRLSADGQVASFATAFRYRDSGGRLFANYGAAGARGQLEFAVGAVESTSLSFRNESGFVDSTKRFLEAAFILRLSSETRWVNVIELDSIDYDRQNNDLTNLRFLTGIRLNESGKTSGRLQLGVARHQRDQISNSEDTSLVARASLTYEASSFSRYYFFANRSSRDRFNLGNEIATVQELRLLWRYNYKRGVRQELGANFRSLSGNCPIVDEQRSGLTAGLSYLVTKNWRVGLVGDITTQNVSDCELDTTDSFAHDLDSRSVGLSLVFEP